MTRSSREDLDRYFEYGCLAPKRTIYLGSCGYTDSEQESGTDFQMAGNFIKSMTYLNQLANKPITIHMNNIGGDWYHGMAIYDAIKTSMSYVTVVVWGSAMSMGSIILQAADLRLMTPNSVSMIHDGTESIHGSCKMVEKWIEESKKNRINMYEIYLEKMIKKDPSMTIRKIEKLCSYDKIYSAQETVDVGLADKIMENIDELKQPE